MKIVNLVIGLILILFLVSPKHSIAHRHEDISYIEKPFIAETIITDEIKPIKKVQSAEEWRDIVAKYFPADEVENALRIIFCESKGDPLAINSSSGATGLFQIMLFNNRPSKEELLNGETNIQFAAQMFASSGWKPWTCK